ncbi:hypothetical protein DFA_09894 [Cavenderia fasciculata]|uniref:phosphomevalonate kinase n=1 Tax=Cavenderia fasciculata TaxID=261658 RepID=F4Q8Q2_CACFS|nr:uncharacterized protein DFA_09894 [Cavenderia fasciculata]EGG15071.1 hypothetical protein DFA_09894 [Cavenderia fasciculata]|eukprot:XP_004351791.1 hypothetical protein DFA_09894 [Cavenderia fasciculata]
MKYRERVNNSTIRINIASADEREIDKRHYLDCQEMEEVCCSAPGKVLVTGGYLVLDRLYDGLVLTINSRFYSIVKSINSNPSSSSSSSLSGSYPMIVVSPQFKSRQYYQFKYSDLGDVDKQQIDIIADPLYIDQFKSNKYVEKTLLYSFIALSAILPNSQFLSIISKGLEITILGGNDFYSQIPQLKSRGLPITYESLKSLPAFLPLECSLDDLQKTGLGSSAALVGSLTAAILSYFGAIDLRANDKQQRALLHNLAQLCHCVAQGKIGSGFDISSAVYGSQIYRRFSPSLIQSILNLYDENKLPTSNQLLKSILPKDYKFNGKLIKSDGLVDWDNENKPMALPPKLELLLADVSIGSNTPVMVKKILEWRKSNPEQSLALWTQLDNNNTQVKNSFEQLHQLYANNQQSYNETIDKYSQLAQSEWKQDDGSVAKQLCLLRSAITQVRTLMRQMGDIAQVPLEPKRTN